MDKITVQEEREIHGASLTVREIRGLYTRIGAELVRTAAGGEEIEGKGDDRVRRIHPRDFIARMAPFLRMN
ncbi:MAG: hypothetical protein HY049_11100 [Acidobacteria bacterium]|nr:hypothetical protein [Acidobacteriota bacterium]